MHKKNFKDHINQTSHQNLLKALIFTSFFVAKGLSFNMTIAVLEIYFQAKKGCATDFMVFESTGELFKRIESVVKHDNHVANFNYYNDSIKTTVRIDRLVNWIISSGYKLKTVLPSVFHPHAQRVPEKYIFEKSH